MTSHPNPTLIALYSAGDPALDDVAAWSVEAHLETCAPCRALLADGTDATTRALLDRVAAGLDHATATGPAPARARRLLIGRTGIAWAVLPWLLTAVGVLAAAIAADRAFPSAPSFVLLLAPVAPLFAVAAAWTRGTDPAWEIVSSSPRAGLRLLLTRTLTVLAVLGPVLALAGWHDGQSPALWLLPCLAFTAGSLVLGGLIGVARAVGVLAAGWAVGVIVPSLATSRLPAVLDPDSSPGWALVTVVLAVVGFLRADDHRRLTSRS